MLLVARPPIVYAWKVMSQYAMSLKIEATPPTRRNQALQLMQLGGARTERLQEAAAAGAIDMQGLFHAQRDGVIVGSAWGQRVPGSLAFCWPPAIIPAEPESTADRLQAAVNQYLDESGITMSQAMLPVHDLVNAMRLSRMGYVHLADLDYLVSSHGDWAGEYPQGPLSFRAGWWNQKEQLKSVIERTYVDTLDCTQLDKTRSVDDVLTGYRRTGVFRPNWWVLARHQDRDVGCVLLADHPEHEQCELMYLGVVPEQRGNGWGLQLANLAQWTAFQAGRRQLVLAVDDANQPATALYRRAGFDVWDRRSVYVRAAGSQAP